VLVFIESRREAATHAASFGQTRPRVGLGIALAEQLDLFSEPTESSEQLRDNAERRVRFHTADLSPQERQVIEAGFSESKYEVCFATSTLAAGVNFPFRSIVFPKLTFQCGDRAGSHLPRSDYRNMSGRAGRLGMHPDGYAILLPRDRVELAHANMLVQPINDHISSQLITLSLRKSILMLVASRMAGSLEEVMLFFQNTLYWYQTLDRNPAKLADLQARSKTSIDWLLSNKLLKGQDDTLLVTPLGNATTLSGLLPSTAVQLSSMLRKIGPALETSFDGWIDGLIYAACPCDEFRADIPARYLPFPANTSHDSVMFWSAKTLPVDLDRADTRHCPMCSCHVALRTRDGRAKNSTCDKGDFWFRSSARRRRFVGSRRAS
jgi:helicase